MRGREEPIMLTIAPDLLAKPDELAARMRRRTTCQPAGRVVS